VLLRELVLQGLHGLLVASLRPLKEGLCAQGTKKGGKGINQEEVAMQE
jgi:hypothetical protein